MDSIDFLEHGGASGSRPFAVRWLGYEWPLEDPREQHYQWVLMALAVGATPAMPQELATWQRDLAFDRWRAAWGLPDFNNARRLAYLVDNYRAAISHDLAVHARHDLGELWRERRWTLLIDIIDRLPAHSWFASAVTMDEDHAEMMAEALMAARRSGAAEDKTPSGPSLTTWTPEVAALNNVLDAVNNVRHAVIAVQAGDKAGEPPKPAPRPVTPLERAMKRLEYNQRKAAHETLVARLLPHKGQSEGQVH